MTLILKIFLWAGAILLLLASIFQRDPWAAAWRHWIGWVIAALSCALLLVLLLVVLTQGTNWRHWSILCPGLLLLAALVLTAFFAWKSWETRRYVEQVSPEIRRQLGRHFMVGYRDEKFVEHLVRRQAIGGIFVTSRNARGKSREQLAAFLQRMQEIQAGNNLPPLFIATDQEGGIISRLSPPLDEMPSVREIHEQAGDNPSASAVADYAREKAAALRSAGVNVNFSPVVDLDTGRDISKGDLFSLIPRRAIGSDPQVVGQVAAQYCAGLLDGKVIPTLKHFPGLGHVVEDTHLTSADLHLPVERLEQEDWVPYFLVRDHTGPAPWIMLAHLRLPELDPVQPASTSRAVVDGLIRNKLGLQNVLVTDDLNMRPTLYSRDGGIGGSCVRALNAGVDMLLIAWIGENYYPAMAAVARAYERGELNEQLLQQSANRLDAAGEHIRDD